MFLLCNKTPLIIGCSVPVYVVVTKIDMCPENIFKETVQQIKKLLKSPGSRKIPVGMCMHFRRIYHNKFSVVRSEDDVVVTARNFLSERIAPIFCVSNVTGQNLDLLRSFLNLLPARQEWDKLQQQPVRVCYLVDCMSVTIYCSLTSMLIGLSLELGQ